MRNFSLKASSLLVALYFAAAPLWAQQNERTVTGRVIDENGSPLIGVAVKVLESELGTVTDGEGRYTLRLPETSKRLQFSYMGMEPVFVAVRQGQGNLQRDVTMQPDNSLLNEVVVTGYQTISKERATGAYTILSAEDLEARHASTLSEALDGLVPGMVASDDGRGGKKFTIRGTSTMNADQAPLIVVDGFPITDNKDVVFGTATSSPHLNALERMNPKDIESVTVLKDAAAASIWGARSANGVIVITTKKARRDEPVRVEVSTQLSIAQKQDVRQLTGYTTSALDVAYQRWAFENGYSSPSYQRSLTYLRYGISPATLLLSQGYQGSISMSAMNAQLDQLAALSNEQQLQDEMLRSPLNSQTNISLSGSVGAWSTRASVMYEHERGDFIKSNGDTWNIDWNNQFRVTRWLGLNANVNLVRNERQESALSLSDLGNLAPYEMLLNADGSLAENYHYRYNTDVLNLFDWSTFPYHSMSYNLLQEARSRYAKTTNTQLRTQLGMQVDIMEGLQWNTKFQYESSHYERMGYNDPESFYTRWHVNSYTPGSNGLATGKPAVPMGTIMQRTDGRNTSTLLRTDLTLNKVFGEKHAVAAVAGSEVSNYYFKDYEHPYLYGYYTPSVTLAPMGFVPDFEDDEDTVDGAPVAGSDYLKTSWFNNRFVSFYGNASYVFDDRYGISASVRSDASNLIASEPKYRWSPMWSVGALWNAANEKFLKDSFVDRLTLRATYGQNGNAASTSSARTTIRYNSSYLDQWTGLNPGTIDAHGNPHLRWEKTATFNVGLDFAFFGGKLFGSVDYYDRRSTDVLGEVNMPAVNGTSRELFNNAELHNQGLEATLGTRLNIGRDWTVGANLSYSYNKNEVTKLYVEANTLTDRLNSIYIPGYAMYPIFTYQWGGFQNGDATIIGTDGTPYKMTDTNIWSKNWDELLTYEGSSVSPHAANFNLSVSWKGLTLAAYMSGRFGGKMRMPSFNYGTPEIWYGEKQSSQIASFTLEDLMRPDGSVITDVTNQIPLPTPDATGALLPAYSFSNYSFFSGLMDINVESSSYIYLDEIDLNWTLPSRWFNGTPLRGVELFGQLSNVGLLWAANSKNYHPAYLPGGFKPARTFTVGASVKF